MTHKSWITLALCKGNLLYDVAYSGSELSASLAHAKNIRTFLSISKSKEESFFDAITSNCKVIRCLDLNRSSMKLLPNSIDKLKHLRYLDLSRNFDLKSLPNSITNLVNLQTLKLNYCSNLRELPRVINLSCEKNVAVEYEKAKLKDKQYLRSLTLEWDSEAKIDETEAIVGYEMSLEGLQPHQNIQNLMLTNYGGVKLSGWLLSLTNLVELTLKDCAKCEYLVPLNQFKCLKHLKLERLICLEYISNTNSVSEDLVGSTTTLLPSLETLELLDLPNLKGWWREIEVDHSCFDANANANEDNHTSLPYYLPSLSKLTIRDCPKLTCMPLYPRLEGKLQLNKTSWKPLEETLRMRMMYLTTPSFSPLSKLERLYLTDIDDLECLPDSFKSLACLSRFHIDGCPKLKDLCPGILHLSSLRRLWISRCERLGDMLISDDYDSMWQALNVTLQSLGLCKLPNIVTVLPRGIQHLTSLQQLEVFKCDSLTTIPEWINNLKSLKSLWLYDCPNLTSFPEGIRSLTTLNLLYIDSCPMLLKRCKRNTGEDWDKISHIEDLTLIPDANKEEENEGCNLLNKRREIEKKKKSKQE
ncbi:hypothetical protein F8388_022401 [Cannabis sativa]|uniref:Uncharacterized protein n=1 Tax=Cannabis sativa TaxID=3483 RepID=A0A7J6EWE4_CANSA|nr:hypothetical protein F8388_022401 [Cannabis sativa]